MVWIVVDAEPFVSNPLSCVAEQKSRLAPLGDFVETALSYFSP